MRACRSASCWAKRMPCEFQARMRLYVYWDQRLAGLTRFFGAAALTNALLAELHPCCRLWVSRSALHFLNVVGARLQTVNMCLARQLADAPLYAVDLDQRIVWHEQSVVEGLLQSLQRNHRARIQGIIVELDRLLSLGSSSALAGTPNLRVYSAVLRAVTRDLGRRIQFAGRGDRVRIGCGLTDYLRQQVSAKELAHLCQ